MGHRDQEVSFRISCFARQFLVLGTLVLGLASLSYAQGTSEILKPLRDIQRRVANKLEETHSSIRATVEEAARLGTESASLSILHNKLNLLEAQKTEYLLRQDFLYRLGSKIDAEYRSQSDLTDFIQKCIKDLAVAEASGRPAEAGAGANLALAGPMKSSMRIFLTNLAALLKDGVEKKENVFAFIDSYLQYSSIQKPKDPAQFLNKRNYTNGSQSETARPVSRDHVGDVLEVQTLIQKQI